MLLDQLFNRTSGVAETSDYARRREREEAIISGKKPPRKKQPAQTSDYARRRAQEKAKDQGVAEGRFDEPLTGWHIVYRKSGNPVHATPSFETKDQAQKYLMTKMFANHQDYKVVHTAGVGVAEGHADQQRKIFKKNGRPVGEVGIDRESSPGVGQWYMKCYAYNIDNSGYDSYEEAVAELKNCLKQGVAEGSVTKKPQPYNDPNWIQKLSKEQLDALSSKKPNKENKKPGVAEGQAWWSGATTPAGHKIVAKQNEKIQGNKFVYQGYVIEFKPTEYTISKALKTVYKKSGDYSQPTRLNLAAARRVVDMLVRKYTSGNVEEAQDACYHKVRSRYKVWPSAYASGALVQCRKKGAANWGTGGKKK